MPLQDVLRWVKHNLIPSSNNNWRLFNRGQLLYVDYPISPRSRYGHGQPPHPRLYDILNRNRSQYARQLQSFVPYYDRLAEIATYPPDTDQPTFYSRFFTGYDALALYGLIRAHKPRRYIEIGSGNSTHFARIAAADEGLDMHITAIDAHPRRGIRNVADTIVETYLEETDLSIFDTLEANDILFLDGSHRAFMNSDVTIALVEIVPNLKPGVLIHIHDIWIPADYPEHWVQRHYSEQYLLSCYLLSEGAQFDVILPVQFIVQNPELNHISRPFWDREAVKAIPYGGGVSFWMKKR